MILPSVALNIALILSTIVTTLCIMLIPDEPGFAGSMLLVMTVVQAAVYGYLIIDLYKINRFISDESNHASIPEKLIRGPAWADVANLTCASHIIWVLIHSAFIAVAVYNNMPALWFLASTTVVLFVDFKVKARAILLGLK